MAAYTGDRSFTNYVHDQLTVPIIYASLGWKVKEMDSQELERIDMQEGIDYVLVDNTGMEITVQERFRDNFYQHYGDATLRYRRDCNPNPERVQSEFYKIKANYLVYGITNGSKWPEKRHTLTGFIKWVVIDLKFIQARFTETRIKIVTSNRKSCWLENDVLYCPENFNKDGSSSFLPLDVALMVKLWGTQPIFAQRGFI